MLTRTRLLILSLLCALYMLPNGMPLKADSPDHDDKTYADFVKRATSGDLAIDFRQFRLACINASACDPKGKSEDLIAMRRAFQLKQYDKAIKSAESLVKQGFVDIEAHIIAAQAYGAMNISDKATFHHDVASGLIRSILASGDGKSKETAFEVIGTSEEYVTMGILGLPPFGSQSLLPGKPHSYDRIEVTDPKSGQKVSFIFR